MSTLLHLSSSDRDRSLPGSSTTNFNVNLNQVITASSILVKSIAFNNTIYNINSTNNILTHFLADGVTLASTTALTPGFYTIDELITALEPLVTVSSGGAVSIEREDITDRLVFTCATAIAMISDPTVNIMSGVLGISQDIPSSTGFTLNGLVDLSGVHTVFLRSKALCDGFNSLRPNSARLPVLTEIHLNAPFGAKQVWESQNHHTNLIKFTKSKNIQSIDIQLTDIDGNILDLNNHHIHIAVKIFPVREPF